MNKAFEFLEAHWFFGASPSSIEVKVHPQSLIHGYLECHDGSHLCHLSPPDMALPVAYALSYPDEVSSQVKPPFQNGDLELLECDELRFPAVRLAREVATSGAGAALRMYVANEFAAGAFLEGSLPFNKIVPCVDEALHRGEFRTPHSGTELLAVVQEERQRVHCWLTSR